jgi:hypothetical protein
MGNLGRQRLENECDIYWDRLHGWLGRAASFVDLDGAVYNAPNGGAEEDPNGNTITPTQRAFSIR